MHSNSYKLADKNCDKITSLYASCRFVVNKPYAIISSSLTFWIPVMVMLTLYHR
jgi:hypothetical protein